MHCVVEWSEHDEPAKSTGGADGGWQPPNPHQNRYIPGSICSLRPRVWVCNWKRKRFKRTHYFFLLMKLHSGTVYIYSSQACRLNIVHVYWVLYNESKQTACMRRLRICTIHVDTMQGLLYYSLSKIEPWLSYSYNNYNWWSWEIVH